MSDLQETVAEILDKIEVKTAAEQTKEGLAKLSIEDTRILMKAYKCSLHDMFQVVYRAKASRLINKKYVGT